MQAYDIKLNSRYCRDIWLELAVSKDMLKK